MSTRKTTPLGGNRSLKASGLITQSIRITVAENNRMHKVAKADGRSVNSWAAMVLKREVEKAFRKITQTKKEEVIG